MFNDYSTKITSPSEINHHYKNAPTHESVALLKELEEKAHEKIFETAVVKDNIVEYNVYCSSNLLSNNLDVVFKINGIQYSNTFRLSYEFEKTENDIHKWISNLLAKDLMKDIYISAMRQSTMIYESRRIP